jgi:signal peptidase I
MEKTLLPGDLIFVNKMSYGIRLPITPLTFPLSHQKMMFSDATKSYSNIIQLPYVRMFKSPIERNDVVVFNYPLEDETPIDHRSFYIKRCIALPGDTMLIKNKKVFINGNIQKEITLMEFNYNVVTTDTIDEDTLLKYDVTEGGRNGLLNEWQFSLTAQSKKQLNQLEEVVSIKEIQVAPNSFADYIFPYSKNYQWNIDYFGKLVIPKKGETVVLDSNNIHIYKRIIEQYERNELEWDGSVFLINGKSTKTYTFKMDYYFMMGDNRHNSSDSRFWGFVPENHIVGKAQSVLFSVNKTPKAKTKYRWDRFFMGIE